MTCASDSGPGLPGDGPPKLKDLTSLVYIELRKLAAGYVRGSGSLTLQPTALVHEAYVRMAAQHHLEWENRGHFFGIAATCMRQILIEHARARAAGKRGGGSYLLEFDEAIHARGEQPPGILALDDALLALAKVDSRKCKMVELFYFGGLVYEEMAETLGVSPATVKRDLKVARAWLRDELTRTPR